MEPVSPGSDQEKTFGPTISGLIHRHIEPERLLLWDSKVRGGRPDTMKILKEVYDSWQAEGTLSAPLLLDLVLISYLVIFITSNYIGNSEMMQVCNASSSAVLCRSSRFHRAGLQGGWYAMLRYIVGLLGVLHAHVCNRIPTAMAGLGLPCNTVTAFSIMLIRLGTYFTQFCIHS